MSKPNVLLITIDCLRADHMSCYGYDRKTTPNIDNLCGISTLYRNHMSNGPTTPNSFPSIMCSRYRFEMPDMELPEKWTTIAEMLKEIDYNTVGMSSMNPWTTSYFGYNKGFDVFKDYMGDVNTNRLFEVELMGRIKWIAKYIYDFIDGAMDRNQEQDLRFAKDVIGEMQRLKDKDPWFMWVHYMDAHTDYFPEHIYYGNKRLNMKWYVNVLNKVVVTEKHFSVGIRNDVVNLYDSAIRQADEAISRLIMNVDLENTMVIITSDHGEGFEEHGKWVHQYQSMYSELLGVPLIIHYPGQNDPEDFTMPTSSVDILPTVSDVSGSFLPPIVRGSSLMGDMEERPIFHEGLKTRSLKFIRHNIPRMRGATFDGKRMMIGYDPDIRRLFDLDVDPNEKENLVDNSHYDDMKHNLSRLIMDMRENEKKTMLLESGGR